MLHYSNAVMQTSQQLNKPRVLCRASTRQRLIAGGVSIGVAVLFAVFALAGHYRIGLWPFGCGFRQRYDLPCPTCGFTTAAIAFAQGEILEAFYIQPAAAFLCCVLVVAVLLALFTAVSGRYFCFLNRFFAEVKVRYVVLALIIIIAVGWAVTLARAIAAKS